MMKGQPYLVVDMVTGTGLSENDMVTGTGLSEIGDRDSLYM